MRTSIPAGLACVVLGLMPLAGQAHHSGAIYNEAKPIKLQGVLSDLEWVNPHVLMRVDVKAADGTTTQWVVESNAPAALRAVGLAKRRLETAVGSMVTLYVSPAKDGTSLAFFNGIDFPDGTTFHFPKR